MTKKFYLTTAIPYVNAAPHIGFALEAVQADVVARYHRLLGEDVIFSSGTDENSLKNIQAAEKEGLTTRDLVNKYAERFRELAPTLNLSYDIFNRTATPKHFAGAQKLWQACKKEDIYKKTYRGLYCVDCELFYSPSELIDGKCPDHKTRPEEIKEENYFFRLSGYQKFLEDLIENDKLKITPETRKNEILSFIKRGLEDFSISRSVERAHGWGVPVPGDSSQIMYVWFDALTTYLTALGYGSGNEALFKKYWLENENKTHIIGKGIIRFHAVYWPAMLKSAGLPLPREEFVHGYVTVEGQKISKSLGNVIDPFELVKKYGSASSPQVGTDAVRYYLLREIPSYGDGDFSERRFKEVYNADLANGLGNLVARVAKLCETSGYKFPNINLSKRRLKKSVVKDLEKFAFNKAFEYIWKDVKWGIRWLDQRINDERIWSDKKYNELLLNLYVETIRDITYNLIPFLPETAEKIQKQFAGPKIKSGPPLFPRLK